MTMPHDTAVEALRTAESWLDRHARHIGNCNRICTCGLEAVRAEVVQAISALEGTGGGQENSALPPFAVPEGFVLVPREPTGRMKDAGFGPFMAAHDPMFSANEPCAPIYRAMVDAAPPPAPADEKGEHPSWPGTGERGLLRMTPGGKCPACGEHPFDEDGPCCSTMWPNEPTPPSVSPSERERVARIIDPMGWETRDRQLANLERFRDQLEADDFNGARESLEYYTKDSLAKADAILKLSGDGE